MSEWFKLFEDRSPAFYFTVSVAGVLAVGFVDYITGGEISFSIFYLFALGMAAWFIGRGFALFISVFSVSISLGGDLLSKERPTNLSISIWNSALLLLFYLIFTELVRRLRALNRGLEALVGERTHALTIEMAERERVESELLEISEREQRRIGRDLHDSLGQQLTGAALAGKVLEQKLAARGLPEVVDAAKVIELIEDGIGHTRKLAKGLYPVELEANGLMEALEELAVTRSSLLNIPCHFECDSPVLVKEAPVSGHLYRIAQEAVSNAARHGKASEIVIRLEAAEKGIELQVRDDGVGILDPPYSNAGMGLRIMAHRADMIGGVFSVRRGTDRGTVVSCLLPHNGGPVSALS